MRKVLVLLLLFFLVAVHYGKAYGDDWVILFRPDGTNRPNCFEFVITNVGGNLVASPGVLTLKATRDGWSIDTSGGAGPFPGWTWGSREAADARLTQLQKTGGDAYGCRGEGAQRQPPRPGVGQVVPVPSRLWAILFRPDGTKRPNCFEFIITYVGGDLVASPGILTPKATRDGWSIDTSGGAGPFPGWTWGSREAADARLTQLQKTGGDAYGCRGEGAQRQAPRPGIGQVSPIPPGVPKYGIWRKHAYPDPPVCYEFVAAPLSEADFYDSPRGKSSGWEREPSFFGPWAKIDVSRVITMLSRYGQDFYGCLGAQRGGAGGAPPPGGGPAGGPPEQDPIAFITVYPGNIEMVVGETVDFSAQVTYKGGRVEDITGRAEWSRPPSFTATSDSPDKVIMKATFRGVSDYSTITIKKGSQKPQTGSGSGSGSGSGFSELGQSDGTAAKVKSEFVDIGSDDALTMMDEAHQAYVISQVQGRGFSTAQVNKIMDEIKRRSAAMADQETRDLVSRAFKDAVNQAILTATGRLPAETGGSTGTTGSGPTVAGTGGAGGPQVDCVKKFCPVCGDDDIVLMEKSTDPQCESCKQQNSALIADCRKGGKAAERPDADYKSFQKYALYACYRKVYDTKSKKYYKVYSCYCVGPDRPRPSGYDGCDFISDGHTLVQCEFNFNTCDQLNRMRELPK